MIGSQRVRLPMIAGKSMKKDEAIPLKKLLKAMLPVMFLVLISLTSIVATLAYLSFQQVNQGISNLDTSLDNLSRATSFLTENQNGSIKCISLPQGYILVKIN